MGKTGNRHKSLHCRQDEVFGRHSRVFASAGDGVHVFLPTGELIGKILVPERPANLCFGGRKGNILFITARTSLYAVPLK